MFKHKKHIILALFSVFLMGAAGFYLANSPSFAESPAENAENRQYPPYFDYEAGDHMPDYFENTLTIVSADGTRHEFKIELAGTPDQQAQGLMYRAEMDEDAGMLFVFSTTDKRSFWMKNTFIPLDMLFIEEDGKIQHIHANAKPQDLSPITSTGDFRAVLEINGGVADKLNINPGDKIYHSAFRNRNLLAQ